MMITLPEPWAWDDYDMLITDEGEAAEAARRAEIVHKQVESLPAETLPYEPSLATWRRDDE